MKTAPNKSLRLFLCGDVMTGRGIDQALPHPVAPELRESLVHDARDYVRLAERANGSIHRPVPFDYVWGDALNELRRTQPDARIINLETSITTSDDFWPGKGIHYRMHPRNAGCLTAAKIDCCCLANNHVLDFGHAGLNETLRTLSVASLSHAGAGRTADEAAAPAVIPIPGKGRVLVFAFGSDTSGIPSDWGATKNRPGVSFFDDFSEHTARRIGAAMRGAKRPGDVAVASIHWGDNWGYAVPREQRRFAQWLIEEGVDIVHGHSSHHARPIEVFDDRLILHGCGDFINDYEGIGGYESYRGDLALMYLVDLDPETGRLIAAQLIPLQMRRFRLNRASKPDARWLCALFNRITLSSETQVRLNADENSMTLVWQSAVRG